MKPFLRPAVVVAALLGLAACTNPYDPGQRALGGGLLGAGTGAAIGAAAGAPATGALIGGAVGALAGAATTPPPPAYGYPYPPPPHRYGHRYRYRRCHPGWHWVRGHHNRRGAWIRAHCAPNR